MKLRFARLLLPVLALTVALPVFAAEPTPPPATPKPPEKEREKGAEKPGELPGAKPAEPTPPPPPPPPPVAPPATLKVTVDQPGMSAEIDGDAHPLKEGDNFWTRRPIPTRVVIKGADGKVLLEDNVQLKPGETYTLTVSTMSEIKLEVTEGTQIEIDGKMADAKPGTFSTRLRAGSHTLLVKRPGYFGQKGTIAVDAGRSHTIGTSLEKVPDMSRTRTVAWAGIIGGSAMLMSAVVLEFATDANTRGPGGDAARWILGGGGSVAVITGTLVLKGAMDAMDAPEVKETPFTVGFAPTRGGASAMVGLSF